MPWLLCVYSSVICYTCVSISIQHKHCTIETFYQRRHQRVCKSQNFAGSFPVHESGLYLVALILNLLRALPPPPFSILTSHVDYRASKHTHTQLLGSASWFMEITPDIYSSALSLSSVCAGYAGELRCNFPTIARGVCSRHAAGQCHLEPKSGGAERAASGSRGCRGAAAVVD